MVQVGTLNRRIMRRKCTNKNIGKRAFKDDSKSEKEMLFQCEEKFHVIDASQSLSVVWMSREFQESTHREETQAT